MKILLKNGTALVDRNLCKVDIMLDNEKIVEIGNGLKLSLDTKIIDCSNKYIFPGIVDAHVHFDMPCGPSERTIDDFYSGSVSAACGGVTTVIDYVEPKDNQMPLEAVAERRKEADGNICIDYGLHYVVREWKDKYLEQLEKVLNYGIISFKVFTAYDHMKLSYENIYKLFVWSKEHNALVTVHAEEDQIVKDKINELRKNGYIHPSFHSKSRPVYSEVKAVENILNLASKANSPVYFVHISTYEAAKLIQAAQENGKNIYAETCPHYLLLNNTVYRDSKIPQLFIMCPPLREEKERLSLWNAVGKGVFSVIATDHCAFSKIQKTKSETFYDTFAGIPGVETLLPLMYSEGMSSGKLNIVNLIEMLSTNPAKLFGLYPQKGVIKVGSDADVVVFDPHKEIILDGQKLHSNSKYSPYDGRKIKGYPEITILRGNIIYKNGKFCGNKGYGKFVPGKKH
jgi:dihydropyrimidinase